MRRLSPQAVRVVRLLAEEPIRWRYGYEMLDRLETLKSGSLYTILRRLEDRGFLEGSLDFWHSGFSTPPSVPSDA